MILKTYIILYSRWSLKSLVYNNNMTGDRRRTCTYTSYTIIEIAHATGLYMLINHVYTLRRLFRVSVPNSRWCVYPRHIPQGVYKKIYYIPNVIIYRRSPDVYKKTFTTRMRYNNIFNYVYV